VPRFLGLAFRVPAAARTDVLLTVDAVAARLPLRDKRIDATEGTRP